MTDTTAAFMELFAGRTEAFGTGEGRWVKRAPGRTAFETHLAGEGPGIGIAPLLDDGTVRFAAIDLDEPDFPAARRMQEFIPGASWVERSRSGNAHVWVFFSAPCEGWLARGLLRFATEAAGKAAVEVFPKQDKLLAGMIGNYINLPYHGQDRPILIAYPGGQGPLGMEAFVHDALSKRTDPDDWAKRARWLNLESPATRNFHEAHEFGTRANLHECAAHIIASRDINPVVAGHRAVVYFNLAKMLQDYEGFDQDEALYYLRLVNESSPDPIAESELRRAIFNAARGRFTSTGCDDVLMLSYVHPQCPIAFPKTT